MFEKISLYYLKLKNKLTVKKPWDYVIIFILNVLFTIPVFIIVHHNIIAFNWYYKADRILIFILILLIFQCILQAMRRITLLSVFAYVVILLYGTLKGGYGFERVFEDYQSLLYNMSENQYPQDIIIDKLLPFPNKSKIIHAIDYENPKVRNFALMSVNKYFKNIKGHSNYLTLIQCLAVFKEINSHWNYVRDPKGEEYFASASESIQYLSGDCDDHSILMAASIRAIGGVPRLIHTQGHIYPELLIGSKSDMEMVTFLIKKELFPNESKGKVLYYHIDERGKIWLNLDYTAKYPGGPFLREEVLGALTLEY
ncbi:transglutaminase [Flavobacterium aciduliphilum]|uniref:Transglutaminase superfamily protein n=1 Tax=Flavobacterium aciduliphilum TaxID=1101402 RepID=A0A328YP20_9FLAO|nr:transglutaminase [Flavobacterium aciduliphilum]RAR73892.1 hypothetical protein CLV55_103212 [Flavobacterium aciduliphilum]